MKIPIHQTSPVKLMVELIFIGKCNKKDSGNAP
jgi:hypothetical protein